MSVERNHLTLKEGSLWVSKNNIKHLSERPNVRRKKPVDQKDENCFVSPETCHTKLLKMAKFIVYAKIPLSLKQLP